MLTSSNYFLLRGIARRVVPSVIFPGTFTFESANRTAGIEVRMAEDFKPLSR